MKISKMLALMVSALLVLCVFSACGGSQPAAESAAPGEAATPEPAAPAESTAPSSGEKTIITIMQSGTAYENDFELEVMPKLIEAQFSNLTVESTKLPDDQYYTALKTKLASGEAPDMFLVQPKYAGANSVLALAKAGYLAPVTELKALELVGESGREPFTFENNVYGVPNSVSILGTYYNKSMFDANGLSVPKNWDEFLSACKTLKDAGIQPITMGDKDMYVMQFGLYQIAACKVYPKNSKFDDRLYTGETKFTDAGTWDVVLEMYKTLYDNGYVESTSLGLSAQQAIQKFVDGEAAMTFDGSFNAQAIRAIGAGGEFERGYFPLPGNAASEDIYGAVAVGGSLAIFSGSKNIDQCKQILEYWMDGESDLWKANADNGRTIVTHGYGADSVDPLFMPFMELYNAGKAFYWCNQGWPAGVENEMEAKFGEAVGGQGTTVADITAAMQMKFDELSNA